MMINLSQREVLILKDLIEQDVDVQHQFIKRSKDDPTEQESVKSAQEHITVLDALAKKLG